MEAVGLLHGELVIEAVERSRPRETKKSIAILVGESRLLPQLLRVGEGSVERFAQIELIGCAVLQR